MLLRGLNNLLPDCSNHEPNLLKLNLAIKLLNFEVTDTL